MTEKKGITRAAALRIGKAARALPGIEVRDFVGALADRIGLPLTEDKLARVSAGDIRAIVPSGEQGAPGVSAASAEAALRYLKGEGLADEEAPAPQPYAEGDMPNSLRVAIASNSGAAVDGHFGSCTRFLIYQVARDQARLIDVRPTQGADNAEDKNEARARLIADCHVVYVQSIGGPAAAKVVRTGAHPVKLADGVPAVEALGRLQANLDAPPPWLAKVMGVAPPSLARFATDSET